MDSTTIRRGVDLAWCLVALAAMWMLTRTLPGVAAVVPFAVAIAVSVTILALTDGERSTITLGIPALMLVLLAVPGERQALLGSGLVLAACLVTAGWRWSVDGRVTLHRAIALLSAALVPAVTFPPGPDGLVAAVVAAGGAIAIVVVASDARRVGIDVVIIAYSAALVTPTVPARAALYAFVVAALILLLRRPGPFTAGLLALFVLAAGKWYLPLLLAVAAGFALHRYRAVREGGGEATHGAAVLPFVSGNAVAAVSTLAIAPDVWSRARSAGVASGGTAFLLGAGALVVPPSLATVYALAAIACLVGVGDGKRWSPVLAAFAVVMTGLTAWSGSISGAFPLPVSVGVIVAMAVGAWIGGKAGSEEPARSVLLRSAIAAGLAALLVLVHPALEEKRLALASDLRIAPGDAVSIPLPPGAGKIRIELSGGNVAGMKGGTVVGVVRAEPGGDARELRVGDFADWGVRRGAHYLAADNPRPLEPAGPVLGEGREAFLSGAGVVRLEARGATSLTIEVLPAIGETGRLLIDSVEVEK